MYYAFSTVWLLTLALPGVLISAWRQAYFLLAPTAEYEYWSRRVDIALSTYTLLMAFLLRKFWARREAMLAYRWHVSNAQSEDRHVRPQFKGVLRVNIVTGEYELSSSRLRVWRLHKVTHGGHTRRLPAAATYVGHLRRSHTALTSSPRRGCSGWPSTWRAACSPSSSSSSSSTCSSCL